MFCLPNLRNRQSLLYCLCPLCLFSTTYYLFPVNSVSDSKINYSTERVTEESMIILWPKIQRNISCYYSEKGDALISTEDPSYSPGDQAIFFLETSCRGGVNSRQACAIESAARLHPKWQINLLFTAPVTERVLKKSCLTKLIELRNVKFARVHIAEYGKGTAVESILANRLNQSTHPIEHAADILRILTLYKYGGIYLDTDSMLIKNLDSLPLNWIAKESDTDIAYGIMRFSKNEVGFNVTDAMLRELHDKFSPVTWAGNGAIAIRRVLDNLCPNVLKKLKAAGSCGGVEIFTSEYFYPVYYSMHKAYFKNGTIVSMEDPYMHHMWNYLTKDLKVENESPYAKLARRFCPTIYNLYGDQFGD